MTSRKPRSTSAPDSLTPQAFLEGLYALPPGERMPDGVYGWLANFSDIIDDAPRGGVHRHDLVGYAVEQTLGALAGTGLFAQALGSWASSIGFARTDPSPVGNAAGVAIEAALTFGLLATIFGLPASRRWCLRLRAAHRRRPPHPRHW